MTSGRRVLSYRGFTVIAASVNKSPKASVYLDSTLKVTVSSKSLHDAVMQAERWVDDRKVAQAAARDERRPNVGAVEEYVDFLTACPPREHHVKMLRANSLGPKSSDELAKAAGWDDYRAANLHYGMFAKDVARWLGLTLVRFDRDDTEFFTSAIAQERRVARSDADIWVYDLHLEFLEAMQKQGIV